MGSHSSGHLRAPVLDVRFQLNSADGGGFLEAGGQGTSAASSRMGARQDAGAGSGAARCIGSGEEEQDRSEDVPQLLVKVVSDPRDALPEP